MTAFEKAARPFGFAAAALLVLLMCYTVYAVLAREFFDHTELGLVEYSELLLMGIIFIALPGAVLRDDNIVVDVVDNIAPKRITRRLYVLGLVLTLAFFTVSAIAMIEPAMGKLHRNQYTMVMEIDRFYFWIPILFGFYLSIPAALWLIVHRLCRREPSVPHPGHDIE